MRQQGGYGYPRGMPYAGSQGQHVPAQRMQHNAGMDSYAGRPDAYSSREERPYKFSKGEAQWQWDREAPKASNQRPSRAYSEGQGSNGTRSYNQNQVLDPNMVAENQGNKEPRVQTYEQDMEIGYEDNQSILSFEGLERKFIDEIMQLTKELNDAEDAEINRHKEKIKEINTRYQDKLSTLRIQHANRREDFLCKESQERRHQYVQAGMNQYSNTALQDSHNYGVPASAGEVHHAYAPGQLESYRDRPPFMGTGRAPGADGRVPYPPGRVYNPGPPYY